MRLGLLRHLRHYHYRCAARAADLRRGEDGQTLLLGIGVIAVVAGLLLVVAGATAVYLDLKTLTSLADSAAAAAVAGVDEDGYFEGIEACLLYTCDAADYKARLDHGAPSPLTKIIPI